MNGLIDFSGATGGAWDVYGRAVLKNGVPRDIRSDVDMRTSIAYCTDSDSGTPCYYRSRAENGGGGGSGGGVWITSPLISGAGSIKANGGDGHRYHSGGAGSGGASAASGDAAASACACAA